MGVELPNGLSPQEIRILQEYRRTGVDTMSVDEIRAIKHPAGGGEIPAWRLAERGFLAPDESRTHLTLTDLSREILAYAPAPSEPGSAS